ncbi:MAG: peptidylprolyl isomerase [Chthoniobacterales bacterium]|nr:peptidylprolyl isomerase [Chthoniobacterales bacterium]
MIRLLLVAIFAAGTVLLTPRDSALFAAEAPEPQVVDGIAAIVNNEVITFSQVRGLTIPRERLLRQQYRGEELEKQIKNVRAQALKDLIDRQLIIQSFRKEKLQLPEYFVEQRMNDIIRENFGGDRSTFIKTLQAQNYSVGEFKKNELEKIIVAAMRGKNVKPNTVASPTKIAEYYRTHRDEFTSKEEIKLRMIMIPSRASDASGSQKALAQEILSKVAAGGDFERMAQMYSEDSTRDVGGDWGWVERKTLAPELEKVAFGLKKGQVSRIVELGGNYYIVKVDDRRGGQTKSLAEVRAEIEKKLVQEEGQRLQDNWLASLRQKATIRTF